MKAGNPNIPVEFTSKQLETNADLVKATGARRVDLVVAEIHDGKMIRFHNIGNLLDVIGSKALVKKTSIDGIMKFMSESSEPPRLALPNEYAKLEKQIDDPKKIGILIIAKNASNASPPNVVEVLSSVLERDFETYLEEQAIIASILDLENPRNKEFLGDLDAKDGEVIVAVLGVEGVEDFVKLPWPKSETDNTAFEADFIAAIKQKIIQADL